MNEATPDPLVKGRYEHAVCSVAILAFAIVLVGSALGAYNFGPFPIQWLTQVIAICAIVLISLFNKPSSPPGGRVLWWMFFWVLLITLLNVAFADYQDLMPPLATTSYLVFVSLRLLQLLCFISLFYLAYWLACKGHADEMISWTVIVGTLVSIVAIYVYVASIYGFYEIPRNRMGTGGAGQATSFTYPFHRAIGTFREPSHLAEWLVVPLFLSLYRRNIPNIHSVVIGATLLLTGSLTGIVGAGIGFLSALVLCKLSNPIGLKACGRFALVATLIFAIFYAIARDYEGERVNILETIYDRVRPIVEGGLMQSNRAYVYEYVEKSSFPIVGVGLGNSNLLLTEYLDIEPVSGFLSLYLNVLYSSGIVGLILLLMFLLQPFLRMMGRSKNPHMDYLPLYSAYIAWLAMFAVNSEELSMMFAIVFALLVHQDQTNVEPAVLKSR